MDRRITNSQLNTDASCSRLHFFRYVAGGHGIAREYHAPALSIGSAIHEGIDAFVKAKQAGETDESALRDIAVAASVEEYAKSRPDGNDDDRFEKWMASQQIVAAMMDAYALRWADADRDVEWLGSEVEWAAPILNPKTNRPMRYFVAAGKYDKLLIRNRKIVLRDHKTTSEQCHPGSAYMLRLRIDTQVSHYVLGLRRNGIEVDEVEWDVIRKPNVAGRPMTLSAKEFKELKESKTYCGFPVEFREHEEGDRHRVWVDGRECPTKLLKSGKKTIIENWRMYRMRAFAKLIDNQDHFFQREIIPITASRLDDYAQDLHDKVKIVRERERTGRWPKNTSHCKSYGRLCPFFDLCVQGYGPGSDFTNLDPAYRMKDNAHEELGDETQQEE